MSAAPGSQGFTLKVRGTGFVSSSVVYWNGSPRVTAFVNHAQLTATILASDVAAAGTASVAVVNPAPGGGTSNVEFFQVTAPSPAVALATASTYSVPGYYTTPTAALAAGDLNGDGKLDLVVSEVGDVAVMLGNGDGTFQPPAKFPTGVSSDGVAGSVVIGDFNNDGKPDLAAGSDLAVYILLGNGDGTFQAAFTYSVGGSTIVAGDFNGDGHLDLVGAWNVAAGNTVEMGVLLGNGDGTFRKGPSYQLYTQGFASLLTGDFNRDGHLDLAIAGTYGIEIALGNGRGGFNWAPTVSGVYYTAAVADFNGDGILDLAGSGCRQPPPLQHSCFGMPSEVIVWLGKGDGTFKETDVDPAGQYTPSLIAGDFNGDGKIDLALADSFLYCIELFCDNPTSSLAILLGNGDGTFQPAQTSAGQPSTYPLAAGDFNGDGRLDLAAIQGAYPSLSTVSVNLQTTASLSPGVLSFAPTLLNATRSGTVTLTNLGTAPLNITQVGLAGPNAAEFAVTGDTCQGATVPPSGNCAVAISFSPAATNTRTAFLTVTDNASVSQQTAALTGNGTVIELTPAGIDFGDVKVGAVSPQKVIAATNTSSSVVDISGISIVGSGSGSFLESNTCGKSLQPKATCIIAIQFVPSQKGSLNAQVSFGVQEGFQYDPKNVDLSGTGT